MGERFFVQAFKDGFVPFFMKQMGGVSKAHMPEIPDYLSIWEFPIV
jgi:hypothetical protein